MPSASTRSEIDIPTENSRSVRLDKATRLSWTSSQTAHVLSPSTMVPMSADRLPTTATFTQALRELVETESPSADREAVSRAQLTLAGIAEPLVGVAPSWAGPADQPAAIAWHHGRPDDPARVLLLGHVDTVWPRGTVKTKPFTVTDGRAFGPGVFDMKAGLVAGLHVLDALDPDVPVSFMVTADEEVGSEASRDIILEEAARAQAVLVLEGAGPGGALKSARKGWSVYQLRLQGVAAHAGLEPGKGRNSLVRLASLVGQLAALDGQAGGRTVNPTTASAGTTVNTIPETAELTVDVRTDDAADQQEVERAIREPRRNRRERCRGTRQRRDQPAAHGALRGAPAA